MLDNNTSDESTKSGPPAPTYNHLSTEEFLNGNIELTAKDVGDTLHDPYSVGWSMNVNSTRPVTGVDKQIVTNTSK
ncbi:hypothetical protein BGZ81_009105, partial [Podila clonocystis]